MTELDLPCFEKKNQGKVFLDGKKNWIKPGGNFVESPYNWFQTLQEGFPFVWIQSNFEPVGIYAGERLAATHPK